MEIRVALFEDNKLVRDALEAILNGTKGFLCSGSYADASFLEQRIRSSNPDVVMMDIEMPGINGIEATAIIHDKFPEVKILIQTVFEDRNKIFEALCSGASGYILKNDSPARQLEALSEVFNGGAPLSASIAKKVLEFFTDKNIILAQPDESFYNLSAREKEILTMMVKGHDYKTISAQFYISYETVRTHAKKIYRKLHVASRSEAILKANQQRLV
jgi:DNA-binding NarL/FixJ family response regulator